MPTKRRATQNAATDLSEVGIRYASSRGGINGYDGLRPLVEDTLRSAGRAVPVTLCSRGGPLYIAGYRGGVCVSISGPMPPSPLRASTSIWKLSGSVCDPAARQPGPRNRIGHPLRRPVGRPPNEVRRYYANFTYQAASWTTPRRVIAKVEWHPGELYPRVGFIVTNMSRPADRVVAFYNQRGTAGQWIKEGKGAIKWTRLSCRTFAANAVRLQLHTLAYNLGNFLRTMATPEAIKDWSLSSLKEKLIKDRRQGHQPWPRHRLPDGRGRHSPTMGSRRFCGRLHSCGRSRPRQHETGP